MMPTDSVPAGILASIDLRTAIPDEAVQISEFIASTLHSSFPMFSPLAKQSYADQWSAPRMRSLTERRDAVVFGAWKQGTLAGLVVGAPPEGGVGTVIWLLVGAQWQSMGLGQVLFTEACIRYTKLGCHKLKLTAPSTRAKKFYQRLSMSVEGFHPEHWWKADFWALGISLK